MLERRNMQLNRIAALALSLSLAFAAGCNRDPNVRKQKYLESGKRYEANGKYKEAAIQFSNALKVDKNYADAHFELAKVYMKMGSLMPAYSELISTVDHDDKNLDARIALGDMLLAGHAPDRAAAQAYAVLAVNPNDADAYALLMGIAQKKGDNAEALKDIQRALSIDPNRAAFHTALALIEAQTPSKEAEAEQELAQAASLDPKSPTPHLMLAELLEKRGNPQAAEQQFNNAIAIAPKDLQPRSALAGLYLRAGDKARAEQTLVQAVQDIPDSEPAAALLAEFYSCLLYTSRCV